MKTAALSLFLLATVSGAALADSCEDNLRKLDAALQSEAVAPDVKAQAQDMRQQAEQLCAAGNEEEGTDVLAEAAALLGIE